MMSTERQYLHSIPMSGGNRYLNTMWVVSSKASPLTGMTNTLLVLKGKVSVVVDMPETHHSSIFLNPKFHICWSWCCCLCNFSYPQTMETIGLWLNFWKPWGDSSGHLALPYFSLLSHCPWERRGNNTKYMTHGSTIFVFCNVLQSCWKCFKNGTPWSGTPWAKWYTRASPRPGTIVDLNLEYHPCVSELVYRHAQHLFCKEHTRA